MRPPPCFGALTTALVEWVIDSDAAGLEWTRRAARFPQRPSVLERLDCACTVPADRQSATYIAQLMRADGSAQWPGERGMRCRDPASKRALRGLGLVDDRDQFEVGLTERHDPVGRAPAGVAAALDRSQAMPRFDLPSGYGNVGHRNQYVVELQATSVVAQRSPNRRPVRRIARPLLDSKTTGSRGNPFWSPSAGGVATDVLRRIARRVDALGDDITEIDPTLSRLVAEMAPQLLAECGVTVCAART